MFWGASPALDFIEEYKKHFKNIPEVLNVFIMGGSDARHIFKTLSQMHKHENVIINFYIVDFSLELVARQLLLLNVGLEDEDNLKLERKTRFFMELYGNTLVRPSVEKFLTTKANYLVDYITRDVNKPCMDQMKIIDISRLKYKDRDYLEHLFKFWASKTKTYDIRKFWDDKVRRALGTRYDNKFGAFDWDLHMKLHQVGANQITIQEYKEFRNTGTSFTWPQSEVSKDNRSFVAGVMPNGENKFIHRGYLGDITIGPYIAYGLTCDREEMMKSQHGINAYKSTDVTEYNLKQIFYQILHGCDYKVTKDEEENKITEIFDEDLINKEKSRLENVKIFILPCIQHIRNLPNSINVLWVSNLMIDFLAKEMIQTLDPKEALIIIEGIKYNPENRKETLKNYEKKVKGLGATLGDNLKEIKFDAAKDNFAKFMYKANKSET